MVEYNFEPGQVVVFIESAPNQIGPYVCMNPSNTWEKFKKPYRKWRWEVVMICQYLKDFDGDPCFKLRRLDIPSHPVERWTQAYFKLAEGKNESKIEKGQEKNHARA